MTATAADIQLFPFTLYGVTIFFINPTEFPVILTEKKSYSILLENQSIWIIVRLKL